MKAHQEPKTFNPVTLTIETKTELDNIYKALQFAHKNCSDNLIAQDARKAAEEIGYYLL